MTCRILINAGCLAMCYLPTAQAAPVVAAAGPSGAASPAEVRLGRQLFEEGRFSAPSGDFITSCRDCHLSNESPEGMRAFADFLSHSWQPWRSRDPSRNTLRNAPTLLDSADLSRLHFDGEFSSLEELVLGTFTGRPMGWLPDEKQRAADWIHAVISTENSEAADGDRSYAAQLKLVYGVDYESLSASELLGLLARAVARYARTLRSPRNSPYDQFVALNSLDEGPAPGQSIGEFVRNQMQQVAVLESARRLQLPDGFGASALEGWKRFHRQEAGAGSNANCVTCHIPPLFTDGSFHNIGVSQREYDEIHGVGSFAALEIPSATAAVRPDARFRSIPSLEKPGHLDLGYWNFANLKAASERESGESEAAFLDRMIATFKTPTLRNLVYTHPYFHNGSSGSISKVLIELSELNEMARNGQIRSVAAPFRDAQLGREDLQYLAAFLQSLNDDLTDSLAAD